MMITTTRFFVLVLCLCMLVPLVSNALQRTGSIMFDPNSIQNWMDQYLDDEQRNETDPATFLDMIGRFVKFRQAMISDIGKAIEEFAEAPDGFEMILGSPAYQEVPKIWQYFFSTSIVLVGNAYSDAPLVAYYNPFLDGVAYVRWVHIDNTVVPESLVVDTFEAPGIEEEGAVPRWLANGGTPIALMKGYQEFVSDFEEQYSFKNKVASALPQVKAQTKQREILEARSIIAMVELAFVLGEDSNHGQVWDSFYLAMESGDKEVLRSMLPKDNIMGLQQILDIPQPIRAQLAPSYVLIGDEVSLLYQQVESAPKFAGVMSIANDADLSINASVRSFFFFGLDVELKQKRVTR